jgi:hypothetical protein
MTLRIYKVRNTTGDNVDDKDHANRKYKGKGLM